MPASAEARQFGVGLARAFGGAIFFSLPLLMTMEMWQLGFYMDRFRLGLFMAAFVPVLVGLSHFAGFEETGTWLEDTVDAAVAYLVGFCTAALVLYLFEIWTFEMRAGEILGKIALEAVPASVGAAIAQHQLAASERERKAEERIQATASYGGTLFLMIAGAIFLAFNVAPTEEMLLIAFKMDPWHMAALIVASLAMMHAFVYAVGFKGQVARPEQATFGGLFLRFTVVGYLLALVVSAYVLWTFGRFETSEAGYVIETSVVLAFPASLGAAAARLVL